MVQSPASLQAFPEPPHASQRTARPTLCPFLRKAPACDYEGQPTRRRTTDRPPAALTRTPLLVRETGHRGGRRYGSIRSSSLEGIYRQSQRVIGSTFSRSLFV